MPVPDMFTMFQDFGNCDYCDKSLPNNEFHHVVVFDGDEPKPGESKPGKACYLCSECYKKLNEPEFAVKLEKSILNNKDRFFRRFSPKGENK